MEQIKNFKVFLNDIYISNIPTYSNATIRQIKDSVINIVRSNNLDPNRFNFDIFIDRETKLDLTKLEDNHDLASVWDHISDGYIVLMPKIEIRIEDKPIKTTMEMLPKDMRIEVVKNLTGKDIINLCQTSTDMQKLCTETKYNLLWVQKIKEEFDIDYPGKDAYNEYVRLSYMHSKKYWSVTRLDPEAEFEEIEEIWLFEDRRKAINHIINEAMGNEDVRTVGMIIAILNFRGEITTGSYKYVLNSNIKFVKYDEDEYTKYVRSFEKLGKQIYEPYKMPETFVEDVMIVVNNLLERNFKIIDVTTDDIDEDEIRDTVSEICILAEIEQGSVKCKMVEEFVRNITEYNDE